MGRRTRAVLQTLPLPLPAVSAGRISPLPGSQPTGRKLGSWGLEEESVGKLAMRAGVFG